MVRLDVISPGDAETGRLLAGHVVGERECSVLEFRRGSGRMSLQGELTYGVTGESVSILTRWTARKVHLQRMTSNGKSFRLQVESSVWGTAVTSRSRCPPRGPKRQGELFIVFDAECRDPEG